MLDRIPAFWRHLIIGLASALLAWAASDLLPSLNAKGGLAALIGTVVTMLIAYLSPVVRQYGVGGTGDVPKI